MAAFIFQSVQWIWILIFNDTQERTCFIFLCCVFQIFTLEIHCTFVSFIFQKEIVLCLTIECNVYFPVKSLNLNCLRF